MLHQVISLRPGGAAGIGEYTTEAGEGFHLAGRGASAEPYRYFVRAESGEIWMFDNRTRAFQSRTMAARHRGDYVDGRALRNGARLAVGAHFSLGAAAFVPTEILRTLPAPHPLAGSYAYSVGGGSAVGLEIEFTHPLAPNRNYSRDGVPVLFAIGEPGTTATGMARWQRAPGSVTTITGAKRVYAVVDSGAIFCLDLSQRSPSIQKADPRLDPEPAGTIRDLPSELTIGAPLPLRETEEAGHVTELFLVDGRGSDDEIEAYGAVELCDETPFDRFHDISGPMGTSRTAIPHIDSQPVARFFADLA